MSPCLLLPPAGVYTQLHVQWWVVRLWKLLPRPQKYESIRPYRLTLTITKSPVIPDTLLGCQSRWTCQIKCLTTGFCEAEDKVEPLNKNQMHNPTAFIHLAFPSISHLPGSSKHWLLLLQPPAMPIPGSTYTTLFTISLLPQKQLSEFNAVRRGRADEVETAPSPPFYCSGYRFLLFHVAAKTTICSLQQVTL